MNQLSKSEIQALANYSGSPCISIYMPAEKAGAETRKNSIRFKNLISTAESKISVFDDNSKLRASLDDAKSYIDNYEFWQHQQSGLAFFINEEEIKYYCLDSDFLELAIASDRFYLQPLLSVVSNNTKFYLLALAQNEVRLFLGDRNSLKLVDLPESIPASLAEALKYDDPEKQTQYHSGDSGQTPIYHGQGVGTNDNKDEIKRFFQQIDSGIKSAFAEEDTPLILAGVEYLLPIYHEINSYSNLHEMGITGNPEHVSEQDLHQQAWKIIQPEFVARERKAIDQYNQLAETQEASNKLTEIVTAAAKGQIDTLFIIANTIRWGQVDLPANRVEIHSEPNQNSIDLYDFAAVNTYLQGGKVYFLDSEQKSERGNIMAILRYPIYAEAEKVSV
ncbi:MAG: hypothetical protein AAGE96_18045 [Cyanobacteria bacterium P01_G01_bin.19]